MKEKILIFGTGSCAEKTYNDIDFNRFELLSFIDNNEQRQGKKFLGKKILSPEEAVSADYDRIIICSVAFSSIKKQLVEDFNVSESKISNKFHFKKCRLIEDYQEHTSDFEMREVIDYIKERDLGVFNYPFADNYDNKKINVFFDEVVQLYYVFHMEKKMYFSRNYNTEQKVIDYYRSILLEQDEQSPHKYFVEGYEINEGDIVIDAGVAEGNFALEIIDKVQKIYLIEVDPLWIEALRVTFAPYKEKVEIIEAFLDNSTIDNHITIDKILDGGKVDYIKMDIEGAETLALDGARKTLSNVKKLKLNICTYHNQDDYDKIASILNEYDYQVSHSNGYMVFLWKDTEVFKLVRGLIRAHN